MMFAELADVSQAVGRTRARNAKTSILADLLARLSTAEAPVAVAYLSGRLPQGRIGVGFATLRDLEPAPAAEPTLEIIEVDTVLTEIAQLVGAGSQQLRKELLTRLMSNATAAEQHLLRGLLSGEIRQGALAGVMAEAIAGANDIPAGVVRRAVMLCGDLSLVATVAAQAGVSGLEEIGLELFRPVQPMLATTAESPASALEKLGTAALEWKIDGARVQIHRNGAEVRIYTRNLKDVTGRLPETVAAAAELRARRLVLDAEVVALGAGGRPHPFQVTMARFGRRGATDDLRSALPLSTFVFDCLHIDGSDLIDEPAVDRIAAWDALGASHLTVPRIITGDAAQAQSFFDGALAAGHEGIVAKSLTGAYAAGRRGAEWLKIKPAHTLDLVVIAVEWGSGRRRGKLSNLHLAAYDPDADSFVMLGKTFKGLTDEMLDWQTRRFLDLETDRDRHVVHVRPEQVVEVAFDGVQTSSRYPGGVALRFARVKGYRDDKAAHEADTIESVRAIHDDKS